MRTSIFFVVPTSAALGISALELICADCCEAPAVTATEPVFTVLVVFMGEEGDSKPAKLLPYKVYAFHVASVHLIENSTPGGRGSSADGDKHKRKLPVRTPYCARQQYGRKLALRR